MNISTATPIKIESYVLTVSMPLNQPDLVVANKRLKLSEVEESFIRLRDTAMSSYEKVEFDRVRALLKYASCFGADLVDFEHKARNLTVLLKFTSLDSVVEFSNTMAQSVSDATMK